MTKLKIDDFGDDRPLTMTIKLPSAVHRDLLAYAEVLQRESGQTIEPNSLVADAGAVHGNRSCIQEGPQTGIERFV